MWLKRPGNTSGLLSPFGRRWAFLISGLSLYLFYLCLVGGDWMVSFRLLVPVLPIAALLAAHGLVSAWAWLQSRLKPSVTMVLAVVGMLVVLPASFHTSFTVKPEQQWVVDAQPIANCLNEYCPADKRVAVVAAGALPYYAPEFEVVDMFALTEVEIARLSQPQMGADYGGHEKFSADLVLKREPDLDIFEPELQERPWTTAEDWHQMGLSHLVQQFTHDPGFWATHSTQTVRIPVSGEGTESLHFNFVIKNPYFCD